MRIVFRHIDISRDNDCLFWTGHLQNGYGVLERVVNGERKSHYTHRYVYEKCEGNIPDSMVLDHICRNRNCVNTSHLRVVTRTKNVLENSVSIAAINKAKAHCINGHEFTDSNTYRVKNGRACLICRKAWRKKWEKENRNRINLYQKNRRGKSECGLENVLGY
jgi:hypothetical protein